MITQEKQKTFGAVAGPFDFSSFLTKQLGWGAGAAAGTAGVFSTVIGIANPIVAGFQFIIGNMISDLFGLKKVKCTDPFTGKVLTGTAACMAASWRAQCSDPKYFDPKVCGNELYDPHRINCPKGSTATGKNQYGVPIGACICDIGVDYREARTIGCRMNPVRQWWPVGAAAIGLLFVVSK